MEGKRKSEEQELDDAPYRKRRRTVIYSGVLACGGEKQGYTQPLYPFPVRLMTRKAVRGFDVETFYKDAKIADDDSNKHVGPIFKNHKLSPVISNIKEFLAGKFSCACIHFETHEIRGRDPVTFVFNKFVHENSSDQFVEDVIRHSKIRIKELLSDDYSPYFFH